MDITFNIKKFSYSDEYDKEILKEIPMLIRRKLSELDKLALSNILKVYEPSIENIVFSSQYGEFERLFKLIEQYSCENEVSPIQFSSSVHNSLAGIFCLSKNITVPYYAISSGEQSLSNGLVYSMLTQKESLFCFADSYKSNKCVACIIFNKQDDNSIEINFNKDSKLKNKDEYTSFIKFLNNEAQNFDTEIGVFTRND